MSLANHSNSSKQAAHEQQHVHLVDDFEAELLADLEDTDDQVD